MASLEYVFALLEREMDPEPAGLAAVRKQWLNKTGYRPDLTLTN